MVQLKPSRLRRRQEENWLDAGIRRALFSQKRQVWLGRYREDVIQADGTIVRTRPQVMLGTKKDLATRRLALRKLDEILFRINAKRYRKEVLAKRKPSTVCAADSNFGAHIIPKLGKLRLDQVGPRISKCS